MRRRVPIGAPAFVTAFVKDKTSAMVDNVRKLRVLFDPLAPQVLPTPDSPISIGTWNPTCELQTVDQAMSMEVMRCGTELGLPDASLGTYATTGLKMSARWRNGRRGSASTWECQSLSCCSSHAVRMQKGQASTATGRRCRSSALAIGTSSTRTVITSTPARSTRAARRISRDDPGCAAEDMP